MLDLGSLLLLNCNELGIGVQHILVSVFLLFGRGRLEQLFSSTCLWGIEQMACADESYILLLTNELKL